MDELGLARMRERLEVIYPGSSELEEPAVVLSGLLAWASTLEHALVALAGLRLDAPVWNLTCCNLSPFRVPRFWRSS